VILYHLRHATSMGTYILSPNLLIKYLLSLYLKLIRLSLRTEVSWIDSVRSEVVVHGVKEEANIVYKVKRRKTNWIGYMLRKNFLLKHITEEKIEWMKRRGRMCKQLLDDLKKKEDTGILNRKNWRSRF